MAKEDESGQSAESGYASTVNDNDVSNNMNEAANDSDSMEPSTQPFMDEADNAAGDANDLSQDMDVDNTYGHLYQLHPKNAKFDINKTEFTVGRAATCDLTLTEEFLPKNFNALSKVHFVIKAEAGKLTLEDKSSNGTFVNKKRVGRANRKGVTIDLTHNSEIALVTSKIPHFIFVSASREHFRQFPRQLNEKYVMTKELGKGACGTVYLALKKPDFRPVAVKAISKGTESTIDLANHNVMNEVQLLRAIDHPCIIRLEELVDTPKTVYIVLELAEGGELFDKIIAKTRFNEEEAKLHFYQILSAVQYLHSKNIAHRDLKPENILLCSKDDDKPIIKVTDLGLSKFVDMHTHLKTFCGTPQYLAPEVLHTKIPKASPSPGTNSYDVKVDMWSLGVILYILLSGRPPFNQDRNDLVRQIIKGQYNFENWNRVSEEAIDLIKSLMNTDPTTRLSASQALAHPWMQDKGVIDKAETLMESQRPQPLPMQVSELNNILPPDFSLLGETKPSTSQNNGSNKRSLEVDDVDGPNHCKRVRKAVT